MLRIPIPAFYFYEDENGNKIVIDGLQRLTTISEFCNNRFQLQNLEYLTEYMGMTFAQLDRKYQRRIEDTQLSINILDSRCPDKIKFDVFRRINTGGIQLNAQEVRNIMASKKTRQLLLRMTRCEAYQAATRRTLKDIRMKSQELCLRYIAYRMHYDDIKKKLFSLVLLKEMLDQAIIELNGTDSKILDHIYDEFETGMVKSSALMGKMVFLREPGKK